MNSNNIPESKEKPNSMAYLFDILDDLTVNQYQSMICWFFQNQYKVTRANIKKWRKEFIPGDC